MNNTERTFAAIKAAGRPTTSHELCNATGLDYHQVGHALSRLREARVLRVERQTNGLHGSCLYSPSRPGAVYGAKQPKKSARAKAARERKRKSRAKLSQALKLPTFTSHRGPACWLTEIWPEPARVTRFELNATSFTPCAYENT